MFTLNLITWPSSSGNAQGHKNIIINSYVPFFFVQTTQADDLGK